MDALITKRLIDLDDDLLAKALRALGAAGISETGRTALGRPPWTRCGNRSAVVIIAQLAPWTC